MAFHYEIDFKHRDSAGNIKFQRILAGSHRLILSDVKDPLDVSLEEIPASAGSGPGTFRLTLTDSVDGPRSDIQGTWPYEIFFDHQRTDGVTDAAVLATGSHFTKMSPQTPELDVALDELPVQGVLDPRLHFVLKDKP
jgi:hypothetical protein